MSAHDSLPACDSEGHCITCSDEGVAMRVLEVDRERSLAVCVGPDDGVGTGAGGGGGGGGGGEEVAIDLVESVAVGQRLLVHAGVALANLGLSPGPVSPLDPDTGHISLAAGGGR